jgi:hypothetical protein
VLKSERLIHANFRLTPAAATDRVIGPAASALALSFFGILGVAKEKNEK